MTTEPTAPPPATAPPGNPPPAPARGRFELVVGASAIMLSVVSLFVAISANRTQERMLAASVWPSMIFGSSNISRDDGSPEIALDLLNRGTGPARIRWVELAHRGKPMATAGDLLQACCGGMPKSRGDVHPIIGSGIQRRVFGAEEWVSFLRMPLARVPQETFDAFDRERHQVRLRACYCSVLDDCWLLDSELEEPRAVSACPAAPRVLWRG